MQAIGGLFGVEKPKSQPQPIIPPPSPPPTIDQAQERQTASDRLRFRKGAAMTRLAPSGSTGGSVGVYKALGG